MHGIAFTALERDLGQVDIVRRFGDKVYFGDPTRPDLLRAAGAEQAKLLIVAMDHPEDVLRVVEVAKRNFPELKIIARARNRRHAYLLMDRAVDGLVRDTFHSSLKMAEELLVGTGRLRPRMPPTRWLCSANMTNVTCRIRTQFIGTRTAYPEHATGDRRTDGAVRGGPEGIVAGVAGSVSSPAPVGSSPAQFGDPRLECCAGTRGSPRLRKGVPGPRPASISLGR